METNSVIVLLGIYYAALIVVVFWRRRDSAAGDYLIASRRLGLWSTVSTLFATYRNASGFVALVTLGVIFQLGAVWLTAGMLFAMVYLAVVVPKIRSLADERDLLTLPDYYAEVFGKASAVATALLIVLMGMIFVVAQFYVGGNVLVELTGVSFPVAILLVGLPVGAYLLLGGFGSVVRTDIFQWFIIVLFLAFPFTLLGRSDSHLDSNSLFSPGWKGVAGFIVSGFFVTLMGADTWQRIYASESAKTAQRALLVVGPAFFLFNALVVLFGIMLGRIVSETAPDQVFYVGFREVLSPFVSALLLVILFAAIMSTIDSYVFINSLTLVKNLLLKQASTEDALMATTRVVVVIYLAVAMVLVLFAGSFLNLLFGATTVLTIIAPSAVYSFYKSAERKIGSEVAVASLACGVLVYVPLFLGGKFAQPVYLSLPLLGAVVGLAVGVIIRNLKLR